MQLCVVTYKYNIATAMCTLKGSVRTGLNQYHCNTVWFMAAGI